MSLRQTAKGNYIFYTELRGREGGPCAGPGPTQQETPPQAQGLLTTPISTSTDRHPGASPHAAHAAPTAS